MPGEQAWKFKPYTRQTIRQAPQWNLLGADLREAVEVVSRVRFASMLMCWRN